MDASFDTYSATAYAPQTVRALGIASLSRTPSSGSPQSLPVVGKQLALLT